MIRLAPVLLAAALASACAHADRFRTPSTPVDRLVFVSEQDRHGDQRPLSAEKPGTVDRIPDPAKVDVASILQVRVDKDAIRMAAPIDADLENLASKAQALSLLLEKLAAVADLNERAVKAMGDPAAFKSLRREYGRVEGDYNKALIAYAEATPAKAAVFDKAVGDFAKEHDVIKAELLEVEALRGVLAAAANARSFRLRMWAAIEGSTGGPVHVEHYDTLAEGAIQYRDRWGLRLSDKERERLDRAMDATRRFADAVERARRGEIGWREALREAVAALTPRLTEIVAEIDALLKSAASWKDRFDALLVEVARVAPEAAKAAVDELKKQDGLLAALTEIHAAIRKLRDDSKTQPLAALLTSVGAITKQLEKLGETPLDQVLKEKLDAVAKAVGDAWQASKARELADSFVADLKRMQGIVESAVEIVQSLKPAPDPLPPAESLAIPLDDAKDTFIDLRRTGAIPGDVLTLKWELHEGDRLVDTGRASFETQYFGHHASLEPSVILATPSRFESGDSDDFHFAPALSWMHRYTPEPDDAGLIRAVLGFLDPAIGPHATFLNFDTDKEVEIGLGGTFSLWGDVLQVGMGYNLMAESASEGGVYFFVGSSLIGLLQALGLEGLRERR